MSMLLFVPWEWDQHFQVKILFDTHLAVNTFQEFSFMNRCTTMQEIPNICLRDSYSETFFEVFTPVLHLHCMAAICLLGLCSFGVQGVHTWALRTY